MTAGLVVAAFLLPLVPIGPYRIVPAPPGSWSSRLPGGAGSPAASVRFDVFGTLRGILPSGASGPNLSGAQVDVLARPCRGFDDCPFVASTTTASPLGNFSFTLDAGTYLLVTNRTGRFAGTDVPLDLTGGSGGAYGPVVLSAEPYLPYGNASFVLPHWNNLSRYAANCNAQLPCRSGSNPAPPYGAQQPLLSWTADGVFYVNATDDLVFDDLATGAVRAIAPWEPLYDNLMEYEGIENTEYLTVDGTYVYEFGCPAVCDSKAPVEFYAVNVSTGRIFSATLTDTVAGDFAKNGQVDLIGERGNLTLAAFAEADGVVLGLNLWNGTQWVLGRLPFFEANNLYWVPMWGSYLDVRAEGASPEDVAQVRLEGPAPGTRLATVANLSDSQRFPVNGVNGVVFNVSAQTLEFTSQNTS
ncbi:MAG TPA: hypothetical protein VMH90_05415, partial [Thermoplasmata archaeon]|nr:hypothetical protein [Thermoplasmata archaeon]